MNMHLRLVKILCRGYFKKEFSSDINQTSTLKMRVWPMDLDLNLHKNNGRYLSCMDLGRFDLAFNLGLHIPMLKHRWQPLLGSSTIRYRKSLTPFQRFELITSIAGWDEKWVFMRQEFRANGETYALAATKVLFRAKQGNIPTKELLEFASINAKQPDLEEWIASWHQADQALGANIKFNS